MTLTSFICVGSHVKRNFSDSTRDFQKKRKKTELHIQVKKFVPSSLLCGLVLKFCKYFSYLVIAILLFAASCNFGVDGTGGNPNPDPELFEEYKSRMGIVD